MAKPLIMVVDDEKQFADYTAEFLRNSGYEAVAAYSAKEALDTLGKNQQLFGIFKNRIRLIILDIKMPEMDGLQFLRKIRKDYEERIGVIILSAYEDEEKWSKAMDGLVAGYVKKPYDNDNLLNHIKGFFESEKAMIEKANLLLYGKGWKAQLERDFDPERIKEEVRKEDEERERKEKEKEAEKEN